MVNEESHILNGRVAQHSTAQHRAQHNLNFRPCAREILKTDYSAYLAANLST